jgi:Double-GTPase 2
MSAAPITCSNPKCEIAIAGRCLEGMEKEECPNFGRPIEVGSDMETAPAPPPTINLAPSITLEAARATIALATRLSRVIAIIATSDAGKTSLIAGLYDLFQREPVAAIRFAGSATLHSFEIACHDSRTVSKHDEPTIFRTPRGDARFYHLDLMPKAGGEIISLLIADRAGEEYLEVSDDVTNARPLFEVRRADTVTVLVDGERLTNSRERHNVRAEIEGMLQGLLDSGSLNKRQRLAIALTKNDAVRVSERSAVVTADLDRLIESLVRKFGDWFIEISSFITTASPKKPGGIRGEGLSDLLAYWLKPVAVSQVQTAVVTTRRDFERLREVQV